MYFDINKSKTELSWQPRYSSDEMFRQSYDWYCKNRKKILDDSHNGSHHQSKVNKVY